MQVPKKILVLCTGNSCRSQMAEGYLRHYAGGRAILRSAGIEKHGVNPKAISVMQEDSIDISHHTSNLVDDYMDLEFDIVITVCDNAREHCPYFPSNAKMIHQSFADPARIKGHEEIVMSEFRRVRDEIKEFCRRFVDETL